MSWEQGMQQRRLRNYRLMFRSALACLAMSVVLMLLGALKAIVAAQTEWLVCGLLAFGSSVGSLYLTVDSTVRIIEVETRDRTTAF